MNLCLVNPPHPYLVHPGAQAPLGILYLAAVVRDAGLDVVIVDLSQEKGDDWNWGLPEAEVYGITGTYLDADAINRVARRCKLDNPNCRVIVGGAISLSPEHLDLDAIDTIVSGEAEEGIVDLVRNPHGKFYRANPPDLALLPWPARDLWPSKLGDQSIFMGGGYHDGESATIVSSRGCPWNCAFCAGPKLVPRRVRLREPEDVIAEMEECAFRYGVRSFRFSDEYMTCNRDHIEGICEAIRKSQVLGNGGGVAWRASVAVRPNDLDLWRCMASAGCKEISLGVESADQDVLDLLNCKKGTIKDAMTALTNAKVAGIKTRALMMVGCPGETQRTAIKNIRFLTSRLADRAAITVFHPLPGCDVAEHPERYKCRIPEADADAGLCLYGPKGRNAIHPYIESELISPEDLQEAMLATVEVAEALDAVGKG